MACLIHLNGPPGIGKSTVAERYVADHPRVLNCDIDVLRRLVGGWREDDEVKGLVRTAALALITEYLRTGHDVVVPQLVARPDQLKRFEGAAHAVDATFVEIVLMDEREQALARLHRRAVAAPDTWGGDAGRLVAAAGGESVLHEYYDGLLVILRRPGAIAIHAAEGAIEATYRAVLDALRT